MEAVGMKSKQVVMITYQVVRAADRRKGVDWIQRQVRSETAKIGTAGKLAGRTDTPKIIMTALLWLRARQ